MKKNDIKAIAFDMDGTLLTDTKQISPRTRACFKALEDQGVSLILSTGRSFEALEPFKIDLSLNYPVICYNGSQILDSRGKIIKNHLIQDDIAHYIIGFARKEGVHNQIYRNGILYFEKRTPEADFYEKHVSLKGKIVNYDDFESLNITKIMYLGDHEYLDNLRTQIKKQFGTRLSAMFSLPTFLEFMDGMASKGNALLEIAENLGINSENIMAFGDGENDISMIETAGIGVAMENATSEVKAAADFTTLSNNDDGIAKLLEEFFGLRL